MVPVEKVGLENKYAQEAQDAAGFSLCLKRKVAAVLAGGDLLCFGWNGPDKPVESCPSMESETGEDYALCAENCPSATHAEIDALNDAYFNLCEPKGMDLYLYGHDSVCPECLVACERSGIKTIYIVEK